MVPYVWQDTHMQNVQNRFRDVAAELIDGLKCHVRIGKFRYVLQQVAAQSMPAFFNHFLPTPEEVK